MFIAVELLILVAGLAVAAIWLQDPTRNWAEPVLAILGAVIALLEFARRRAAARHTVKGVTIQNQPDGLTVVEGKVKIDTMSWGAVVTLPPFVETPEISIFPSDASRTELPVIQDKTTDSFALKITKSSQAGIWRWRARGKLLKVGSD